MTLFLDLVRKEKVAELLAIEDKLKGFEVNLGVDIGKQDFSFSKALFRGQNSPPRIIGEVKPSSPSTKNFELDESFSVPNLISKYESGGVGALSVLTDKKHFSGSYELLKEVRINTTLPILQKEFIVDILQMKLGRMCGANAVLLLTHYFTQGELETKIQEAENLGLEPVVEISIEQELDRALKANPKILLINNRPISLLPEDPTQSYLKGDVNFSRTLWENRPELQEWKSQDNRLLISASCFSTKEDLNVITDLPYDCILMGNALSNAQDPKEFLHKFMQSHI